jgi:hypothetical protein
MINIASIDQYEEIKDVFNKYKHLFPHIRQDYIKRMIESKSCVYEDGVVIMFNRYKRNNTIGKVIAPKNTWTIKQIVSNNQGNGSAQKVLEKFLNYVDNDVYLSVREDNYRARQFYRKNNFEQVSDISWKSGLIMGCVYVWRKQNKTIDVFT